MYQTTSNESGCNVTERNKCKEDDDVDATSSNVEEEEHIKQKTEYEQQFIEKCRLLFSETLTLDRYLLCDTMKI